MLGMDEILDYIKELSRDAGPMFQIDPATGRVYRREREIWDVYEEAKK